MGRKIKTGPRTPTQERSGYLVMRMPGHPLAGKTSLVRVHRIILYDKIGPGVHACHWCLTPVSWGGRGAGRLYADHIDGNKANNTSSNLVPSCSGCNTTRRTQPWSFAERATRWTFPALEVTE